MYEFPKKLWMFSFTGSLLQHSGKKRHVYEFNWYWNVTWKDKMQSIKTVAFKDIIILGSQGIKKVNSLYPYNAPFLIYRAKRERSCPLFKFLVQGPNSQMLGFVWKWSQTVQFDATSHKKNFAKLTSRSSYSQSKVNFVPIAWWRDALIVPGKVFETIVQHCSKRTANA